MSETRDAAVAPPPDALSPERPDDTLTRGSPEPTPAATSTTARDEPPDAASDAPSRPATAAEPAETHHVVEDVESHLWLRRADQLFLAVLAAAALGLMLWHWGRLSGWGLRPVEIERLESRRYEYQVDVNTATWVEWIQLDSVGETLAQRIIEDREQNGPFRSIDDLQRVRGIGPKTVEKLRPWLKIEPPADAGP